MLHCVWSPSVACPCRDELCFVGGPVFPPLAAMIIPLWYRSKVRLNWWFQIPETMEAYSTHLRMSVTDALPLVSTSSSNKFEHGTSKWRLKAQQLMRYWCHPNTFKNGWPSAQPSCTHTISYPWLQAAGIVLKLIKAGCLRHGPCRLPTTMAGPRKASSTCASYMLGGLSRGDLASAFQWAKEPAYYSNLRVCQPHIAA